MRPLMNGLQLSFGWSVLCGLICARECTCGCAWCTKQLLKSSFTISDSQTLFARSNSKNKFFRRSLSNELFKTISFLEAFQISFSEETFQMNFSKADYQDQFFQKLFK